MQRICFKTDLFRIVLVNHAYLFYQHSRDANFNLKDRRIVVSLLVRHSVITLVLIVKVKPPYILKDTIHVDWN